MDSGRPVWDWSYSVPEATAAATTDYMKAITDAGWTAGTGGTFIKDAFVLTSVSYRSGVPGRQRHLLIGGAPPDIEVRRYQRPSRTDRTQTAASPAVDVRSTSAPRRTGTAPAAVSVASSSSEMPPSGPTTSVMSPDGRQFRTA